MQRELVSLLCPSASGLAYSIPLSTCRVLMALSHLLIKKKYAHTPNSKRRLLSEEKIQNFKEIVMNSIKIKKMFLLGR